MISGTCFGITPRVYLKKWCFFFFFSFSSLGGLPGGGAGDPFGLGLMDIAAIASPGGRGGFRAGIGFLETGAGGAGAGSLSNKCAGACFLGRSAGISSRRLSTLSSPSCRR